MDLKAKPREFKPYRPFNDDEPLSPPPTEAIGKKAISSGMPKESAGQSQPIVKQKIPLETKTNLPFIPPSNLPNLPLQENVSVSASNAGRGIIGFLKRIFVKILGEP